MTSRRGGSQACTKPVEVSLPSSWRVYQRPPSRGSMMTSAIGASPMWWRLGHHEVMPAVKTSKAFSGVAGTTTDRWTDSTVWIILLLADRLLESRERALPHLVEVAAQDRQPGRIDLVQAACARLAVDHQADVLEHLQVLGDRGPAHRELGRELADRPRAVGQAVE